MRRSGKTVDAYDGGGGPLPFRKRNCGCVDDFERAEKSFGEKDDKAIEGFFLIYNKFKKTLDQYGVKAMAIEPGTAFNADVHEAITQSPAPTENLKGKIVDVIEKGYLLNDKVIRFAKVVVGS